MNHKWKKTVSEFDCILTIRIFVKAVTGFLWLIGKFDFMRFGERVDRRVLWEAQFRKKLEKTQWNCRVGCEIWGFYSIFP